MRQGGAAAVKGQNSKKKGWSYRVSSRTDRWAVARQIALKSDGSGLSRRIWRCHGSPQKTMVMKAHGLPMINGAGGLQKLAAGALGFLSVNAFNLTPTLVCL